MRNRTREDLRNVNGCFGKLPTVRGDGSPCQYYHLLLEQRRNVGRTADRKEMKEWKQLGFV